jgi:hypothetical protein
MASELARGQVRVNQRHLRERTGPQLSSTVEHAMEMKVLEVRDKATFIPVVAIRCFSENHWEKWYLRTTGYDLNYPSILLMRLRGAKASYDAFEWGDRTMQTAHQYIEKEWSTLQSGSVVDVEFILGETIAPKFSERFKT